MKLIEYPKKSDLSCYEQAITRVTDQLMQADTGCVAVYQVGGVGSPGISDIDLVAVFADETEFQINPISQLPENLKYLFSHNLFGSSKSLFRESHQFTFFHNYKHLAGESLLEEDRNALR